MGKNGGNMATSGAVLWQFKTVGQLSFDPTTTTEEALLEAAMEGGAEDIDTSDDEAWFVTCDPNDLSDVKDAVEAAGLVPRSVELTRIPENTIQVEVKEAKKILELLDLLEDHDDVQAVYSNLDIPDDLAAEA